MKPFLSLALAFLSIVTTGASADDFTVQNIPAGVFCYQHSSVNVYADDWHAFNDESLVSRALNSGRDAMLGACGRQQVDEITVHIKDKDNMGAEIAAASWYTKQQQWKLWSNYYSSLLQKENTQLAAKRVEEAQRKAKEDLLKEREKQKHAALADCGAEPAISGGPWFSSTYKVAARDSARSGFLCVKTVEYISAAPNPFGGNAARARFVGYQAVYDPRSGALVPPIAYELTSEVRDFPY